ncbi:MAG: hypothetical protein Q8K92_09140 [Leadbetterella sp.]|nr:hypothetical protein [Leadbetterella sp.]
MQKIEKFSQMVIEYPELLESKKEKVVDRKKVREEKGTVINNESGSDGDNTKEDEEREDEKVWFLFRWIFKIKTREV